MNDLDYRAPRWLPGSHLQTIIPALISKAPQVGYRRERWDTPDHDFIDIDWVDADYDAPLMVLLHGLEGSSQSHYARALMARVRNSAGVAACRISAAAAANQTARRAPTTRVIPPKLNG